MKLLKNFKKNILTILVFVIISFSLITINYRYNFTGELTKSNKKEYIGQTSSNDHEFLPDINWTFINRVDFISGNNDTINNITDLQFDDNNTYDITGNWTGTQWEYEIYFSYEVDLNTYQLDYYDIYLFLDIEQPIVQSGLIEIQTNSSYSWVNFANITNQPIRIEECFLERTTNFRLIGVTSTEKVIKINRIALILVHEGSFDYITHIRTSSLRYFRRTISHPPPTNSYEHGYYPDWFLADGDSDRNNEYMCENTIPYFFPWLWTLGVARYRLDIDMYMDFDFSGGLMTGGNSGEFDFNHRLCIWSCQSLDYNTLSIAWNDNWYIDERIRRAGASTPLITDVLCDSDYFRTYWDKIING